MAYNGIIQEPTEDQVSLRPPADIFRDSEWRYDPRPYGNPFRDAVRPSIFKCCQPMETSPPKEFEESRLGRLLPELRDEIWKPVIGPECTVGLTHNIQLRTNGIFYWRKVLLTDIVSIAGVCRATRAEIFSVMQKRVTFIEYGDGGFDRILRRVPPTILRQIGSFHMCNGLWLTWHVERCSAQLLEFLCNSLPNLTRFQLSKVYHVSNWGHPGHEQEQRPYLRFGAFLIAKHKNMDMLIWPGHSGPIYEPAACVGKICVEVASNKHYGRSLLYSKPTAKYLSATDAAVGSLSLVEDRLLNSTLLRRTHWDNLVSLTIDDLTLDRRVCETFESDEGHNYLQQVDRHGYMTRKRRAQLGKPFIPVDRLIDICTKRMRKAIANGSARV